MASAAIALTLLTSCGGANDAPTVGDNFEQVKEFASAERQLSVYSAATDDVNARLADAFESAHPDIDVSITRLSSGDLRSRFASETSIGAQSADAIIVTDKLMFTQDPDWFAELTPAQVPKLDDAQERFRSDRSVGLTTSPWVATMNTDKLPAGPVTWKALADSDLLSKTTLADPELATESVLSFYQLLKEEYGDGYLKTLGKFNKDWFASSVPAVQKVAAGQVGLAAPGAKGHSQALLAAGAPLEVVVPEPVLAYTNQIGIASNAEHPNAARLFTDFLLSDKGQAAFCGDDLYQSVITEPVQGCKTTSDDVRIADPLKAAADRDNIIAAFDRD